MTELLREAFREIRRTKTAPIAACGTADDLARILDGGKPLERQTLAAHAAFCPNCAAEIRVAIVAAEAVQRIESPTARLLRAFGKIANPSFGLRVALVAGAVAMVAIPLAFQARREAPEVVVRGASGLSVAVVPADGAVLAAAPSVLSFRAEAGAARFRVKLFDDVSTPIWESPFVDGTAVEIPAEVQARLAQGGSFDWRVVRLEAARTIESPLFRFSVTKQ